MAVIVAGALLVSGCGSGDDGSKDDAGGGKPEGGKSESPSASASASAEKPEQPGGGGADDGKSGRLPGIWKAKGKQYVLAIVGDAVTLLREETNCTGRVMDAGGQTLVLKCPGGTGEDRTNGKVGALKGKSMKVSWNGGATDVYARVADAPVKLPKDPKDMSKLIPAE